MNENLIECLPGAIAVFHRSAEGTLTLQSINSCAKYMTGNAEHIRTEEELLQLVHPEDRAYVKELVEKTSAANEGIDATYRLINSQGKTLWVHHTSNAVEQPGGACLFYALFTDVTEQKTTEVVLKSITDMYTVVELTNLDDDTYIDMGSIELVKKLMRGVTSTKEVLRMVVEYLVDDEFREEARRFMDTDTLPERLRGGKALTMDYNGSVAGWCRGQIIPVSWHSDGRAKEAIFTVQRIQDEKIKADHLRKLSETDGLTQLLNRTTGEAHITKHLTEGRQGMFCLFDVDNFKHFNDHYGHAVGDEILQAIGACMREVFREEDVLMRAGGDEFVIFVPGMLDHGLGEARMDAFLQRVSEISIAQMDAPITVSIGVVYSDSQEYTDFSKLFIMADMLMYRNKRAKKSK